MNETHRRRFWIDNINGAAVGDVNSERDFSLVCNQPVATCEFLIAIEWRIDDCDLVGVKLLSGE